MISALGNHTVSDIFHVTLPIQYCIPRFQREYIWSKEEWDNLYSDVSENDPGYFLGSIICIHTPGDALGPQRLELVDGQQRLTTIALFLCAIYERLLRENRSDDESVTTRTQIKRHLLLTVRPGITPEPKLVLSQTNQNHADYLAVLSEVGIVAEAERPAYWGNRKISRAFRYFKSRLQDLSYDQITELLTALNQVQIIKIEVANHSNAFVLFESLNDRGVPLSAIDIIKNKAFAQIEARRWKTLELAAEDWQKLIEALPNYKIQERFLRQHYNAFSQRKEFTIENISVAKQSNLIDIYATLLERDIAQTFDTMVSHSRIYGRLVAPTKSDPFFSDLQDLSRIGAASGYTFLLYLFSQHGSNTELLGQTVQFFVKYFTRRNLTDFPATRNLDRNFRKLVQDFDKDPSKGFPFIRDSLLQSDRFAPYADALGRLKGPLYEDNPNLTRFLLCKLEEWEFTRETQKDLWEKRGEKDYSWTIEHILPEGRNLPPEWTAAIAPAAGPERDIAALQSEHMHKLGNLTLTVYNARLSNLPFTQKRDRTDEFGRNVGYKNGLWLNRELAGLDSWTIENIENRTVTLANRLMEKLIQVDSEK